MAQPSKDERHETELWPDSTTWLAEAGLRCDLGGEIATVTLTRPQRRNAMTPSTWHGLARIGDALPDPIRVVVLRGAGPSFSAGFDLRMFQPGGVPGEESFLAAAGEDDAALDREIGHAQAGYMWLRRPDIVSVAAVQGHAIGAGFQLALACDLRILTDDATLCMKEAALGLVPDLTGTKPLCDLVGLPRAIEMCLTARTVDAAEARELGLAETVVPADELTATVDDLVAALLAVPHDAASATKRLLTGARERDLEDQAAAEREEQAARLRALSSAPRRD